MNTQELRLIYVWDAYCGWCYGFSNALGQFHKNHPELPLSVLSGGLFIGEKKLPIASYTHIPEANNRIAQLTGAQFGDAYQELLQEGSFVLDSEASTRGLIALEHFAPERSYELAAAMQKAFYYEGKSLSDKDTYRKIAADFGLDSDAVINFYDSQEATAAAVQQFESIYEMGVNSYPTLLLQKGDKLIKIGGGAMTADKIEENLQHALSDNV